jgi:phage gpG-like protein
MIETHVNLNPTLKQFKKLGGKLADTSPLMEEVGQYLVSRIETGFKKEVDPYNKKWQPLSPATISEKERKGYPLKILTRTGTMRSSIRYTVKRKSVQIVVDTKYATFHQTGTRKMPKRQIIPDGKLPTTVQRDIIDMSIDYLGDI